MIFKLAVVAGMGREETLELLLACGESPYNVRRPLELLCWFCQGVPGVYTWADIQNLLERYEAYAARKAEGRQSAQSPSPMPQGCCWAGQMSCWTPACPAPRRPGSVCWSGWPRSVGSCRASPGRPRQSICG